MPEGVDDPRRPTELVTMEQAEAHYLSWVVQSSGLDRRALATALGLSERTLYRKLRAYGLSAKPQRLETALGVGRSVCWLDRRRLDR